MEARSEARAQDAVGDRLADQEFLERAAGFVEEVDRAVLALVAVDPARLAADRQGRVEHFRALPFSSSEPKKTSKESPGETRRWKSTS